MTTRFARLFFVGLVVMSPAMLMAQQDRLVPAPDRRSGEGLGPFPTLTIRNVVVIDGTGAPPAGPMDVVIERNRIARMTNAGTPGVAPRAGGPPPPSGPDVIDGTGMYEQFRFGQVARLWDQIYPPGSPERKEYLQEHVKLRTIFDPTMTAYAARRDVMRMRNADWHDRYTLPSLMAFYEPKRENHGSYFFDWTLSDEIAWRNFYHVWFGAQKTRGAPTSR